MICIIHDANRTQEMRKQQQWKKQLATFGFDEPVDEMDVEAQQP